MANEENGKGPERPDIELTPKSQQGIIAVETAEKHYRFLPAMKCGGCNGRERLLLCLNPLQGSHLIRDHALQTGKRYTSRKWKGVVFCKECNRTSDMGLPPNDVIEMTTEEWNEYLQKRQKYDLDV